MKTRLLLMALLFSGMVLVLSGNSPQPGSSPAATYTPVVSPPLKVAVVTSSECVAQGGRVVNTLGEDCRTDEEFTAKVSGMRCVCICCIKKGS